MIRAALTVEEALEGMKALEMCIRDRLYTVHGVGYRFEAPAKTDKSDEK